MPKKSTSPASPARVSGPAPARARRTPRRAPPAASAAAVDTLEHADTVVLTEEVQMPLWEAGAQATLPAASAPLPPAPAAPHAARHSTTLPTLHDAAPWTGGPVPELPRPDARVLRRCLMLAALLHLWLAVLVGTVPPGTAEPGRGVGGSINLRLGGELPGPSSEPPVRGVPRASGGEGSATAARQGGAVRDTVPRADALPGAARPGDWSPATGAVAAQDLLPAARAPAAAAAPDEPAGAPAPRGVVTDTSASRTLSAAASPMLVPPPTAPLPDLPATATVQMPELPAAPAVAGLTPSLPAAPPPVARTEAALAPMARAPAPPAMPLAALPAVQEPLAALPAAPAARVAPPLASPALPSARQAPLAAAPLQLPPLPAVAAPQRALATLPSPAAPASALSREAAGMAPVAAPALSAPPLPSVPNLPAISPALPAPVQAVAAPGTPVGQPQAVPAPAPETASASASASGPAPAPASEPAASRSAGPVPDIRPAITAPAPSGVGRGAADAGDQVGRDVATPASAASAPKLNLELPRSRGGELSSQGSRGVLQLMARPPEVKSKLATDIEKAGKADCAKAYAGAGLLAAVPLAVDALKKDGGCKW